MQPVWGGIAGRVVFLRALAAACLLAVACLAAPAALAADKFTGTYNGIAGAAGMSLSLQEADGRVAGRFVLPDGRAYALNGERSKAGAEGALRIGGSARGAAFFHIEERPLGIQFLFIPARPGGLPDLDAAREYSFLRQGISVSSAGRFAVAPEPGKPVDVLRFIDDYRQWEPRAVARAYAALDDRSRGLILLYDHAAADILWRVCLTGPPDDIVPEPVLNELLERQRISCTDYVALVHAAQKSGLFPEFLRRARFQFEIVRATELCNRGQSARDKCADVSALGAPLILRWRDAASIMRELADAVPGQPVAQAAPKPPLRASIAEDRAETKHAVQKKTSAEARAGALVKFMNAKRRGLHLPMPNPRR